MQSAGFTETRSHPPLQNFANPPKLRCRDEYPHFVYSVLALVHITFLIYHLFLQSVFQFFFLGT